MSYFDFMVMAVPKANKEEYIKFAESTNPFFKEMGAKRIVYCWEDQLMPGKITDFYMAVQAKDDEAIVVCFYEWPDKETHDNAQAKMREGGAMPSGKPPFDGTRMIMGSFSPVIDD